MWGLGARFLLPALLLWCGQVRMAGAWDSGDLELFDLVEEIQQNFYEFLGVEQVTEAPHPEGKLVHFPYCTSPCQGWTESPR
ncbi:hypothetical protein GDO86_019064 [Hymenochirus boettgeri]|uniref:Uncharacterized protein n=1 Tax=Hymenochirus boettgeri TaxID=247094 RepID=A0A8T2IJP2_9PIPI|nr:hypothetical protein GDO86_019064 [Hymenochirus boettgeri]